ncbi:MarR family winged helix-turn-helix transcriptional regulator [Demequina sp. NBRC 110053]|uniref:MarR family winged helix-turn-helix transcriptional regulator n=1 Tax=Demequina sp. NBRC 110053 TaxID=1570342 RepID=UPI00135664C7|nr:MarR family transcriptional regulator [Demequina sp. NBRC 110053]
MTAEVRAPASSELSSSEELLWRRFSAVIGALPGILDERLRAATGLNHFQYTVLDALSRQPGGRLQLTQIARSSDASLSRLSHSITRLEAAGLVTRETCDHDRRASWAVLTGKGASIIDESRNAYTGIIRATLLDRVPAEHQEALTALLTSLLPGEVAEQCAELDEDLAR